MGLGGREGGREGGKKGYREENVDLKWKGGSWSYTVSFIVPFDVADRFQNYFVKYATEMLSIKHCTCNNSGINLCYMLLE